MDDVEYWRKLHADIERMEKERERRPFVFAVLMIGGLIVCAVFWGVLFSAAAPQ